MNTRVFLSPRRWRQLGWSGLPLLAEVMRSYFVYQMMDAEALPVSLQRLSKASPRERGEPEELVRITDWFLHPIHGASRCMPRAAILFRMLSRRGFDPTVVYGVARGERELDGHAWVLLGGEPLGEWDDPSRKFVETYRYSGKGKGKWEKAKGKWEKGNGKRQKGKGRRGSGLTQDVSRVNNSEPGD